MPGSSVLGPTKTNKTSGLIEAKTEALSSISSGIAQKAYEKAQPSEGAENTTEKAEDQPIDAEFDEVDEQK